MVVAFCMSVSHYKSEWSLSSCLLILPLQSTLTMRVTSILGVPILPVSPVLARLRICACVCVIVHVFCVCPSYHVSWCGSLQGSCGCTSQRMCAVAECNYSDRQGNCPPSPTAKRILILSGLTVPPNERERGGGITISFPQRTTRVNCLAFCSLLWWKSREKRAEKQTKPSQRAWTATQRFCASASRNGSISPCKFLAYFHIGLANVSHEIQPFCFTVVAFTRHCHDWAK